MANYLFWLLVFFSHIYECVRVAGIFEAAICEQRQNCLESGGKWSIACGRSDFLLHHGIACCFDRVRGMAQCSEKCPQVSKYLIGSMIQFFVCHLWRCFRENDKYTHIEAQPIRMLPGIFQRQHDNMSTILIVWNTWWPIKIDEVHFHLGIRLDAMPRYQQNWYRRLLEIVNLFSGNLRAERKPMHIHISGHTNTTSTISSIASA